jgi:hypothetical protein
LAEVGFSDGRDVTFEYHTVDGHLERLSALAADLVRRRPAAIIVPQEIPASVAKAATRDIPIIFLAGNDPVKLGLVASLNRPGSNLTGVAMFGVEIAGERLELLHKAVPAAETIALLVGPDNPYNQAETRDLARAAERHPAGDLPAARAGHTAKRDVARASTTPPASGPICGKIVIAASDDVDPHNADARGTDRPCSGTGASHVVCIS